MFIVLSRHAFLPMNAWRDGAKERLFQRLEMIPALAGYLSDRWEISKQIFILVISSALKPGFPVVQLGKDR